MVLHFDAAVIRVMLRPHPSQASWATDLDAYASGCRDLYIRASVLRVTSSRRRATLPEQIGQVSGSVSHRLGIWCCRLHSNAGEFPAGHVEAFITMRGVPRTILYDNLKSVVLERIGARDSPVSCPTGPPTEPDVQVSRIRLFETTPRLARQPRAASRAVEVVGIA